MWMGGWETNMRNDTVYKHDYLDTWWSVFFHFLPLLEGISYFHNNMCMKLNKLQTSSGVAKARRTKSTELSKRRSFLIQLRICSHFSLRAFASIGCGLKRLVLWEQRMVVGGQRKQTVQWQTHQVEVKKKKRKPEIQGGSTLSSFPLIHTMDTLTAFPSVSGGSDNPLKREGKFPQSQGA